MEFDADKLQEEFNNNIAASVDDANTQSIPDASESPSASCQVQETNHNPQILREEWAATRIQTAFRGFLVFTSLIHVFG